MAVDDDAGGESEEDGEDDDGEELSLGEGLEGVHEEAGDELAEAVAGASGLHHVDLVEEFLRQFVGLGHGGIEHEGEDDAEDAGEE